MYSIICQNTQAILREIRQKEDVNEYDWLIQAVQQQPWPADFESRYRRFWRMRGVAEGFYPPYFQALRLASSQQPNLSALCTTLCRFSTRKKKNSQDTTETLQFSYPAKLCHMINTKLPIYDSFVARFYLFREPSTDLPSQMRINAYVAFYDFLKNEYARILNGNLLKLGIDAFEQGFDPQRHSDEKIVDWLIWGFVRWADTGALLNGQITYL